ncbi:hypothetical protein [Vibrio sp. SCSIO 43136]|uniref:hypothetical protein n=1 Tax=Vibrio sp. SCSIO 43136 TaxID=2819101 RepID=UPI002075A2EE|nr:hypothetical protein [Vibrio sp. SCSIO 43136]USD64050.1 hypothetical protein J4N39_07905 [Vibrio sp. SCSIO 43136]
MRKLWVLVAVLVVSAPWAAKADIKLNLSCEGEVYVCSLTPFNETHIEVGVTEEIARYKTAKLCQESQGEYSIFCKPQDAECKKSSISLGLGDAFK